MAEILLVWEKRTPRTSRRKLVEPNFQESGKNAFLPHQCHYKSLVVRLSLLLQPVPLLAPLSSWRNRRSTRTRTGTRTRKHATTQTRNHALGFTKLPPKVRTQCFQSYDRHSSFERQQVCTIMAPTCPAIIVGGIAIHLSVPSGNMPKHLPEHKFLYLGIASVAHYTIEDMQ